MIEWSTIHAWRERCEGVEDWWAGARDEERAELAEALRDRTLYALEHEVDDLDADALKALVERVKQPQLDARVDGLSVSFHPTADMKLLRFVKLGEFEASHAQHFARPCASMPELCAVFVNPREFNFRTFENIIPIDRLAQGRTIQFEFAPQAQRADGVHTFGLGASEETASWLLGLDALGLYVDPLETNARGGRRFIFHCAALAEALTQAAREGLPADRLEGFSHVNPVFRCNRFEPGDAPFERHLDAPYYDPNQGHVSTHTLILYLTGGAGDGVLEVEGLSLDAIAPMSAALFHQSLEHKGAPFAEGHKIFLRTELIYHVDIKKLDHDPRVGAVFSRACYMDHQSLFHPELSEYMQRCYERVSRAHWEGLDEESEPDRFVHKSFRGAEFLANGYDFWFRDDLPLKQCAMLALFDTFNAFFRERDTSGVHFYERASSEALEPREGVGWIPGFLKARPALAHAPFDAFPKERLFTSQGTAQQQGNRINFATTVWGNDDTPDPPLIHASLNDLGTDEDMCKAWEIAQDYCKGLLNPAPVLIMGREIFMDPERILVHGDKIYMTSEELLEPFNFASDVWNIQCCLPQNFLDVDFNVHAPYLLVPPIQWRHVDGCYHLMLDFFHNDWMIQKSARRVPLPRLRPLSFKRKTSLDESDSPWLNAVEGLSSGLSETCQPLKRSLNAFRKD